MSYTHINKTILTKREPEDHFVAWLIGHEPDGTFPTADAELSKHRYRLRHYMGYKDAVWADLYVPVYWETDIINMPYEAKNITTIIAGINENIENVEDRVTELETKEVNVNFLSFTDYLTRSYIVGTEYTTRLLAIENGQPTSDINITNVVGCTILSRTYIGNGFDIVFTPTADEFSFTASLASDSSVNVVYSSTAEEIIEAEHLTYTDGSTAVVLHAMTLSSTPSVALRSGAGEATVTAIEFEELDTDDIIVIP